MHTAVCLNVDGSFRVMRLNHDHIVHFMKGTISIVGAIDDAQAIAVARQYSNEDVNMTCAKHKNYFESDIRGTVLLVGSNDEGQACDLDSDHVLNILFSAECTDVAVSDDSHSVHRA